MRPLTKSNFDNPPSITTMWLKTENQCPSTAATAHPRRSINVALQKLDSDNNQASIAGSKHAPKICARPRCCRPQTAIGRCTVCRLQLAHSTHARPSPPADCIWLCLFLGGVYSRGQRRWLNPPPEVKRHVFRQYAPSSIRIRGRKNFLNFFSCTPRVH